MSTWRYIARRATTGEFLNLDVPISRDELSWALSGPGSLRGTISPDIGALRASDGRLLLEEWGTLLYVEAEDELRWGGIVITSKFSGSKWQIEAAGFSTYPHGQTYEGNFAASGIDPADSVREIWRHLQSYPDGNLGVTVNGYTPVRLGTPEEPYELRWWDSVDAGREIDDLAKESPFDYVERVRWVGDDIAHSIDVGYPRLGRRRDDLYFVQGDNVLSLVAPEVHGDDYANEVIGLGVGEGEAMLRRYNSVRDGRLRRSRVYSAKDVADEGRLDALIERERISRSNVTEISSVLVLDHPNAPLGSWSLGDDILIEASLPWLGDVAIWHRVVGWSLVSESVSKLDLVRSDSFRYGG